MELAITTAGLTKRFGAMTAVRDLDLKVPAGALFGFLGPNGAGKTTTLRMLLGLVRPSSGTAAVYGHDLQTGRRAISDLVGGIVEVPSFHPSLTGDENLRAMALASGESASKAHRRELLERVGLATSGGRRVKEYSLGMRQRLGIAAALLGDPRVLFLDEPTNGLDPEGAREMRDLLISINQAGRTIFLSSHLLGEVERTCTDVAILQHGQLRLQGSVQELLDAQGFDLRVSSGERAQSLLELPKGPGPSGPGWITVPHAEAAVPTALRKLLGAGVDVFEVRPRHRSLEALFFETTDPGPGGEVRP